MFNKTFLQKLGFNPKDNTSGIFYKNYPMAENYRLEVNVQAERFNFGDKIKTESGATQNFSQEENWVVFECVNRLLEKGYKPEDIILEKTWKTGHGTSGRLDISVKKNKQEYLMIECKTWGQEFEKEFKKMQKDGGQLFTYFQQDKKAEYLILYASQFDGKEINYKNEIIKIEEYYREAGNVKDFFDRWNKLTKQNGIFEDWVNAYEFQNKALTKKDLKPLEKEDSVSLFNRFEAILRKHTVSDGPNAFNKIFNLFLAKIFDEKKRETDELGFQWIEGVDNQIDFQVRLINLHKEGMLEFLKKEIEGIKDSDFSYKNPEELREKKKKLLKFNKIFDIKEVFDDESFEDNGRVLKEVVELLSKYQVRYPRKQQHLSDFFERLLTTGLKQKAGQFFTPPPVARFIIKSLPMKEIIAKKLSGEIPELPAIIDYAAGSGHFLTESMEEMQKIIDKIDTNNFFPDVVKKVKIWQEDKFDWASKYIYGIEKDYRLVKVAKIGCYFYGDGLAQVIYGDGLDNFSESKNYRGILKRENKNQDNPAFDFVISNPPYSVQRFRADIKNKAPEESFDLYEDFTDNSKEIECLFIERTKQLLRDGGIASVILPSSILSNGGVYTKAREVLFKYFEIIAITELGSGTFMATGTNTVILFLRRRANKEWENIQSAVDRFFQNYQDFTVDGLENIYSKYVNYVWDKISFEDFVSLCQNKPNEKIKKHDIYKEYEKKIKAKNDKDKQEMILKTEKEKLLYFILAYSQKVVVVKSGKKKEEKAFLGYDFSNRRGYEGIHSIQRSRPIDECTKMFDSKGQENPEKADYYVRKAFLGEFDLEISDSMKPHIFQTNLIDMMTFDRVDFEKTININDAIKIESVKKFENISLENLATFQSGLWKGKKEPFQRTKVLRNTNFKLNNGKLDYSDIEEIEAEIGQLKDRRLKYGDIILEKSGGSETQAIGRVALFDKKNTDQYSYSNFCARIRVIDEKELNPVYLWLILNDFYNKKGTVSLQNGIRLLNLDLEGYKKIKIPLPPKNIQEKIMSEIEKLDEKEEKNKEEINKLSSSIGGLVSKIDSKWDIVKIEDIKKEIINGSTPSKQKSIYWDKNEVKWATIPDFDRNSLYLNEVSQFTTQKSLDDNLLKMVPIDSVLLSCTATIGKVAINKVELTTNQQINAIVCNDKIMPKYLALYLKTQKKNLENLTSNSGVKHINHKMLNNFKIHLPPKNIQQKIVVEIEKIEDQISKLSQKLDEIKKQKEEVLKKYL